MARREYEEEEVPEDDLPAEGEEGEGEEEFVGDQYEKPQWLRDMPFWALSAILHMVLFLILLNVVSELEEKREREIPITVRPPPPPPPKYDPTLKRDVKKTPKILDTKKVKDPIIKRKRDQITPDIPKGTSLDHLTNLNLQNSIHDAIGVGGGAAGAYGERWGKGSLWREGGSDGSEEAVRAALEWLRRHQAEDGSWSCADFVKKCKKTCQSENASRYGDGRGFPEHDVGVTGLAILAFAGYGHTHRDGVFEEYVECLRKAVAYLKRVQVKSSDPSTNGRFGPDKDEQWIYDHSIATMAMAELLVMSNDVINLQSCVSDAIKLCLRAQNDGFGWRYGIKPGANDTSVTGWMVLALKTAKNARLKEIPKDEYTRAFAGALNWFNRATAANGKTGYIAPGDEGSRLQKGHPDPYPYSKELSCMTAVGVLCRIFSGESRKTKTIRDGIDILMAHPPKWQEQKGRALSTINMYYWYYGSYALFQYGGEDWKKWNEAMQAALLSSQRQGNICEDGSWDPIGEWGIAGGRVYSTAIGAMTLEVYYRFRRMEQGMEF